MFGRQSSIPGNQFFLVSLSYVVHFVLNIENKYAFAAFRPAGPETS
jgi:hypothetical protein